MQLKDLAPPPPLHDPLLNNSKHRHHPSLILHHLQPPRPSKATPRVSPISLSRAPTLCSHGYVQFRRSKAGGSAVEIVIIGGGESKLVIPLCTE
ncbi:hypothetical protein ACFX1X_028649 [Malus domestica]